MFGTTDSDDYCNAGLWPRALTPPTMTSLLKRWSRFRGQWVFSSWSTYVVNNQFGLVLVISAWLHFSKQAYSIIIGNFDAFAATSRNQETELLPRCARRRTRLACEPRRMLLAGQQGPSRWRFWAAPRFSKTPIHDVVFYFLFNLFWLAPVLRVSNHKQTYPHVLARLFKFICLDQCGECAKNRDPNTLKLHIFHHYLHHWHEKVLIFIIFTYFYL